MNGHFSGTKTGKSATTSNALCVFIRANRASAQRLLLAINTSTDHDRNSEIVSAEFGDKPDFGLFPRPTDFLAG